MKKLLRVVAVVFVVSAAAAVGGYVWVSQAAAQVFERRVDVHDIDFPVPFPAPAGPDDEVAVEGGAAPPTVDAMAAALDRGAHLVSARYGCQECHGADFGGGTMMDAMPVGRLLGPNLTLGEGSVTRDYAPADWDRAVRHGVAPDGRPLMMPALDFQRMSDQELSDIVAFIRSLPAVDREVTAVTLGPVGKFLLARGIFRLSADQISTHQASHLAHPPTSAPTAEFGQHLAATCVGCHKTDFTGGDIGGDPDWAPAANLTPAGPLADYTLDDFRRVLREGVRPDGTPILEPMTYVMPAAERMSDVEIEAMYVFLRSLPARETVN